jgi:hypothetical protein
MKYFQIRTALLTFTLSIVSVPIISASFDKWREPEIDLPQTKSGSTMTLWVESDKKLGGGASGGQTCDEFVTSLGKLSKQSRKILAVRCASSAPKE